MPFKTVLLYSALLFLLPGKIISQQLEWQLLPNSPFPDSSSQRFEDVHFPNINTGYIAQYSGKIYKTTNGGNNWTLNNTSVDFPHANYRCLGFFDAFNGLLGTLRFNSPLYRTSNGGANWIQVGLPEPRPYGICGVSIVDGSTAYAVGRYSAPANVIKTTNLGLNWTSIPMDTSLVRTLVDCYFWSPDSGIVVGGYNINSYQNGNAVILITSDGGASWQRVYRSGRSGEWCWKISFISKDTGFVSIERHSGMSYYLKTTDRGFTWQENPFLVYDQEGIGFINSSTGWIGGWTGPTYKTTDGGANWSQLPWSYFVNRFRFMNNFSSGYAVGDRVYKLLPYNFAPLQKFAVIGDYGSAGNGLSAVASYVHSWQPDFVITAGNNNYETGSSATIDSNIGRYFSRYIHPYTGNFGSSDTVNRFFPALGSVDWMTSGASPYLNYFTLPGNERYYEFKKGNIRFFCLDSDPNEPDGTDSNSVQALWLKDRLAQSDGEWNIVYFNHPPYTSGVTSGPAEYMRWPFKKWGASAVISGSEHNYERLSIDGLPYFVNGLGGKSIHPFGAAVPGSVIRYNSKFGYMAGFEFPEKLELRFYTMTGQLIDTYSIYRGFKTLELTAAIEGYVDMPPNPTSGEIVSVTLRKTTAPFEIVDSVKTFLRNSGPSLMTFFNAANATDYYIVINHKNSIETWSSTGRRFSGGFAAYSFTDSSSKAYGNNLLLKSGKYCIYSGDVNQDDIVDAADFGLVDNSAFLFASGNVLEDLNGDSFVDAFDLSIVDNNSFNFVSAVTP
ncbi:MAG: metallophosphoesterase [Ignavibacteria bacterium]|nr:metallophosphoesterase [Ignavibacteria bacterium]